jgi:hypothetical protein
VHTPFHNAVRQDPEEGARRRLLHFLRQQVGSCPSAFSAHSVAGVIETGMKKPELKRVSGSHMPLKWLTGLVEAAGVEPASEKVRRVKPTCVSGSGVSAAPYTTGKSERRLVRLISVCCSGPKLSTYPAK